MLTVKMFCVNMMNENTYVVSDDTKECVIIDCGCQTENEQKQLSDYIDEMGLTPKRLLCTHFHLDHIFGNQFIKDKYGLDAEINPGDRILSEMIHFQAVAFGLDDSVTEQPTPQTTLDDGLEVKFGRTTFRVILTPGHSPGGVSFYSEDEKAVFTGDTIFRGYYGAVNLPGGRLSKIKKSIIEKLFALPDDVTVYPGHGAPTTIGEERNTNAILVATGK